MSIQCCQQCYTAVDMLPPAVPAALSAAFSVRTVGPGLAALAVKVPST